MESMTQVNSTLNQQLSVLQRIGCIDEEGKKKTMTTSSSRGRSFTKAFNAKRGSIEEEEDKFNVIMDLSDEEDVLYLHTNKKLEYAPPLGRSFAQIEMEQVYGVTSSKKFTVKPEVLVHRNPDLSNNLHKNKEPIVGKKLPLTPSTVRQTKITGRKRQSSDRPLYTDMVEKQKFSRDKSHIFSEHMVSNFRATVDMKLSIDELYLAAYIFHPHEDISEEIFKIGDIVGTLKEFGSLCPDRVPANEILTFIAAKNTWLEDFEKSHKIWCLPSSFSSEVIAQIMRTEWFPPKFANGKIDLDKWEISDAFKPSKYSGETESEFISKSILWIMDWMYMTSSFQPNTLREMNQNVLRMKVAMDLLNGQHNELWNGLQAKSKGFWMMSRYNEHQC